MCRSLLKETRAVVEHDHWEGRKPDAKAVGLALTLYQRAQLQGLLSRVWAKLTRDDGTLVDLDTEFQWELLNGWSYVGIQYVPIERIAGSVGRCAGLDKDFYPLPKHDRRRWLMTAVAQSIGIEGPPIEMIQIGSDYYAQSGQYQISVAKALGKTEVRAYVTNWEVGEADTPASSLPPDSKANDWNGIRFRADRGADRRASVDRVA